MGGDQGQKNAEQGITQAGSGITAASAQTPAEASQYAGSFDIGKLLQQIYQSQQGTGTAPVGYKNGEQQLQGQGALGQGIYNTALQGIQNPDQQYISTLAPQLSQAQDAINSYYQQRGLLSSGLSIESMGRAGVDLAIKQAQGMMDNRQQMLNNALGISQYGSNLEQSSTGNLYNLYNAQQGYGQQSMNRQAAGAAAAAPYMAYPYQAQLGKAYADQNAQAQTMGAFGPLPGLVTGNAQATNYGVQNSIQAAKMFAGGM